MSQKSIISNYFYNLMYQILLVITPLITTPYISRVLGATGVGTVGYVESIASYFALFATFGISTYGQREISYVQDSAEKRSIVFWNTKLLSICTSGVALMAYLILAFMQDAPVLYLIMSLNILAITVDITWFFQGLEEFRKIVLRNTIITLLNVVYLLLVVKSADDIYLYAFGRSFFIVAGNLSLWFQLPKYVQKINFRQLHPFCDLKVVLSLFVPTIAIQVYTVLDKTMIGFITRDYAENGYYEQAMKITKVVLTVVTALGTVMIPRIGFYIEKKEHDEVLRLLYRGYRFVWFMGVPLCLGLISVAANVIPWFLGPGYDKAVPLLQILSILIPAIGISNVTGTQYLIPAKRQQLLTVSVVIGAGINLVMNAILIPRYQALGAAIASVTAELIIAVVQLVFVRKELSPLRVLKEGVGYVVSGGIMAVGVTWMGSFLAPSIANTAILVSCGAVIYFTCLIVQKDEFLLSNINSLVQKIRK